MAVANGVGLAEVRALDLEGELEMLNFVVSLMLDVVWKPPFLIQTKDCQNHSPTLGDYYI